jgi:hypothetical protein
MVVGFQEKQGSGSGSESGSAHLVIDEQNLGVKDERIGLRVGWRGREG